MLTVAFIGVFLTFAQFQLPQAIAQETDQPPQAPILRVNPRMHTAPIRRVAANAGCTVLATASEDKTVKLWSLPGGQLRLTLRPPIGNLAESNNGKVYAAAVSPDGLWTAAGGWTRTGGDHWVYIFSNATGEVITRLGATDATPLGYTVQSLAISPDGKYLAAVLTAGGGLRVWERKSGELTEWTAAAADTGYGRKDATGVAFDKALNLFTVAQDHKIRRYSRGQWRMPQAIQWTGKIPYSVSVHPDMKKIAVGFANSTSPGLYKASSLYPIEVHFEGGVEAKGANLAAVSWSPSGNELFAGGSLKKDGKTIVRVWHADGSDGRDIANISEDGIFSIIPCGGAVALSSAEPSFGLLRADGTRPFWFNRVNADMRGKLGDNFTVSSDGTQVRFGLNAGGQPPALFDATSNTLSADESSAELKPATVEGLPVSGAIDTRSPQTGVVPIPLEPNEYSRSLAILPDLSGFFLGTDYGIRYIGKDGGQIWQRQTPGTVWGLNLAQDGKLIVAALGDGTIRWYRAQDHVELLALFVDLPSKRWIAWTPKGYFAASEGAENLIGWHLNRGWRQSADFFEIAKFRDTFYRPDIISQVLPALDEDSGIGKANELRKRKHADENILNKLPPVIEISSPVDGGQVSRDAVEVSYVLRAPGGVHVSTVIPLISGEQARFSVVDQPVQIAPDAVTGKLNVKVPGGDVELALVAQSDRGDVSSNKVRLIAFGGIPKSPYRPRLFGLVVGIGHYDPKNKAATNIDDIPFAANDADDVKASLDAQIGDGKIFRDGKVEKLTDGEADRSSLVAKLSWLRHATNNDPADVIVFYFSGHGKIGEGGASLLLPYNYNGDEDLTALTKTDVLQILEKASSKIMMFIDACHGSGGLDTTDFVNSVQKWSLRQAMIFASSKRNQKSYGKGRNSYYTRALLEALRGASPVPVVDNMVTTSGIDYYLVNRVPPLAKPDLQDPIAVHTDNWLQVPIATVKVTVDPALPK